MSRYGGVLILANNYINAINLPWISKYCDDKNFECCGIKFRVENSFFIVLCVYRSPSGEFTDFTTAFSSVISKIIKLKNITHLIVAGDFNIDFSSNSQEALTLFELFTSFNLTLTINSPTRVTDHSATVIDNILVNCDFVDAYNVNTHFSDHYSQRVTFNTNMDKSCGKLTSCKRIFNDFNCNYFNFLITNQTWQDVISCDDVNDAFKLFHDTFLHNFNCAFPIVSVHSKRRINDIRKKWLTPDLIFFKTIVDDLYIPTQ